MKILAWFTDRFSRRGKALKLYRRGMDRARQEDHQGAIDDYTATIGLPDVPPDVKAMAMYNRALVYVAHGDHRKGADDLDAILLMDGAPPNVRDSAKHKLARMEARSHRNEAVGPLGRAMS